MKPFLSAAKIAKKMDGKLNGGSGIRLEDGRAEILYQGNSLDLLMGILVQKLFFAYSWNRGPQYTCRYSILITRYVFGIGHAKGHHHRHHRRSTLELELELEP